jgi:hypothetical protein
MIGQRLQHEFDKTGPFKLHRRDIDRHAQGHARIGPAARLFHRHAQDRGAHRHHQPALFGNVDEQSGDTGPSPDTSSAPAPPPRSAHWSASNLGW